MEDDNTIKITMTDVLGPDGLEGAWEAMVQKLTDRAESKFLHTDSGENFHRTCVAAIEAAVQRCVENKIQELMASPIQPTNRYGEPQGEPTTFTEMIGAAVDDAATGKVDDYGKRVTDCGFTVVERAIRKVASKQIDAAVKEEVAKLNAEAKAAISKRIAEAVAEAIQ